MAGFILVQVLIVAALVFVPMFIIAIGILREPMRAFVLSSWFSIGATFGGFMALALARLVLTHRHSEDINSMLTALFVVAGAAAFGVLAVFVLNKNSRNPPWRRN